MKTQILIIHGGDAYNSYDDYLNRLKEKELTLEKINSIGWKENLKNDLGVNFNVLTPKMPNPNNAKYAEWKIWFEKIIPLLGNEIILIGHSLGGIFIVKYLCENNFPKRIKSTFLIAAPFNTPSHHPLADFNIESSLNNFIKQAGEIYLFHSTDDEIVPFSNAKKYKNEIPNLNLKVLEDRGHFNTENFPELIEELKNYN